MRGFVRAALASVAFAGLAACGGSSRAGPGPSPAPAPAASANVAPSGKPIPIEVQAQRVGSRYVFLTKQKRNRKVYVLRADAEKGHYFGQDTGRSTFLNPHVVFYSADGKRLIADAPTGTVVEKDKTVRMSGGVHAKTGDGLSLRSDTLVYDDERELVHGTGNVTVTSPQGEELQGETLDWNLRDGTLDVAGAR